MMLKRTIRGRQLPGRWEAGMEDVAGSWNKYNTDKHDRQPNQEIGKGEMTKRGIRFRLDKIR